MHIKKAEFSRVIPSDGKLYGEIKVWPVRETLPMLAWFVQGEDDCLTLSKLIRKQEELDLDWYDNDLRQAFDDVTEEWFVESVNGGGCNRTEFEREILDYGEVASVMEQRLWEAKQELADSAIFSPYAAHSASNGRHPPDL
ncbi:MAG: hypothetical protein K0R57_5451 [Paenibacillaceae bacterium]|jgi:hypothetical protein|nr:hypothetical protein [Paenibacillaceae bacterium]